MRQISTKLVAGAFAAIVAVGAVPAAFATIHSASATTANCSRGQLGVRANGTNGAAGTIHGAWVFTNLSRATCTLNGYPDLRLYGPTGRPIRITVRHSLPPGPAAVSLAPGGSGTFYSSYSDVPSGATSCPRSAVAEIAAPNTSASLFIPARLAPCRGVVNLSAVRAGVHPA